MAGPIPGRSVPGHQDVFRAVWPPRLDRGPGGPDEAFDAIDRLEASGPQAISRFLAQRVSAYVKHLAAHVPALRAALPASGAPSGALTLASLPAGSRVSVRDHLEANGPLPMPRTHGAAKEHATSGSTGIPLRFYMSDRANEFNALLYLHDHLRRQRRDPSLATNFLSGKMPAHSGEHLEQRPREGELLSGLIRMRKAAGHTVESHADWLRRHPAAYLNVHPRLLGGILDTYQRDGNPARGIRQILTVGETVDAGLRTLARELLGARIVDRYSSEESGPIAFQCPSRDDWYHVSVANVVVETVDETGAPAREGVPGRVLVTAFNNWSSPILRYELGDQAALHRTCGCGARIPALTHLLGRTRQLIRLPNGERRFLRVVAGQWLEIAPVREWRVTQRQPLSIEAELVCARPLTPEQRLAAVRMLQDLTDPAFRVSIIERDAIDWGPSYKRQDVVCLV